MLLLLANSRGSTSRCSTVPAKPCAHTGALHTTQLQHCSYVIVLLFSPPHTQTHCSHTAHSAWTSDRMLRETSRHPGVSSISSECVHAFVGVIMSATFGSVSVCDCRSLVRPEAVLLNLVCFSVQLLQGQTSFVSTVGVLCVSAGGSFTTSWTTF